MKLKISIILLFLVNFSYGMFQEIPMPLNGEPLISFVSKNDVSATLSVQTYKYITNNVIGNVADQDGQVANSENVQLVIDAFLSVQGVSRCTFDRATQTFTILTSPAVNLSQVEKTINKN